MSSPPSFSSSDLCHTCFIYTFFFPLSGLFVYLKKKIPVRSFHACILARAFLKIQTLGIYIVFNLAETVESNLVRVNSNCLV